MTSKIVISKCGFATLEKKLASGMDTHATVVRVVFDEQGMFVHNGVLFMKAGPSVGLYDLLNQVATTPVQGKDTHSIVFYPLGEKEEDLA
jgi:hypothetical protein